ncbi:MAG: site-specific DNA-methyltransferase [Proteobacteria bacterium]|nr:site-specific DNA-methyltransferase [Pseudomonadota bacterium]
MVTDPPYGIAWATHGVSRTAFADRALGDFNGEHRDVESIRNDEDTRTRDEVIDLWGRNRPGIVFGSLLAPPPVGARHGAVYVKPLDAGSLSAFGKLRRDLEGIWFLGSRRDGWGEQVKSGRGLLPQNERPPSVMRSSVFATRERLAGTSAGVAARAKHPHAKPLDVLQDLIVESVPNAAWVLADPFAGSGSTLVAARNLGRRAVGVEIEEKYCEIIANHLAKQTLFEGVF